MADKKQTPESTDAQIKRVNVTVRTTHKALGKDTPYFPETQQEYEARIKKNSPDERMA